VKKIRAYKVSGYVLGPCTKCGEKQRGLVMYEDYKLGWECLACGEADQVDEVEWVAEEGGPSAEGEG
jgi:hypothetical protein